MTQKSTFNKLPYDVRDAYYRGLAALGPDAEHDAEEFGIAYGEPMAAEQYKTGKEVAALIATHSTVVEAPDDAGRREWIDSMHLGFPSHEYPALPRRTPEDRAADSAHLNTIRAEIRPLGDRPTKE